MKLKRLVSCLIMLAVISPSLHGLSAEENLIISSDCLLDIASGYTTYTIEDGYVDFESFVKEHKDIFSGYHREHAEKEQVVLSFITNSEEFGFDYVLESEKNGFIEVYVDGVSENAYNLLDIDEKGRFSYSLTGRECRVDIYLPRTGIKIKDFFVNPGSTINAVTEKTKAVFYGDSITFGTGLDKISESYVSVLSRIMDYEFLNYGIGGYYFNPKQFVKQDTFEPDIVFVAYGANDSGADDISGLNKTVEEFMYNLRKLYPEQKVYVITPLWTNDRSKVKNIGNVREIISEVCREFDNVQLIDGLSLIPSEVGYFSDGLHPNRIGNIVMAKNIALNMDDSLYTDVTELGDYDEISGNFTFHEYPADIVNGNAYAYYKDCVLGLDGCQAVYEDERFYVPTELMDILSGKKGPAVYNGNVPGMLVNVELIADNNSETGMKCRVDFTNMLHEKEISGTFRFTSPEIFAGLEPVRIEKISANGKYSYEFECPGMNVSETGVVFESELKSDDGDVYKNSSVFRGFVASNYARNQVKADGIIGDEWKDALKIRCDGESAVRIMSDREGTEDLSFEFSVMWDEEFLYFYADVTDNVFSQTNTPDSVWKGDSVQLGLYDNKEGRLLTGYAGSQFEEIALAVVDEKPVAYRFGKQTQNTQTGIIEADEDFELGTEKNDAGIVYEMKISWSKLFGREYIPQKDDSIGFSVLVNDDDGSGRRGWMEYGSGIGYSKNVNEFVRMQMISARNITVVVDGQKLEFDVEPVISEDRVLVPLRIIFEKIGANVEWDSETRTVISSLGDKTVKVEIDSNFIDVNGERIEIDVPARIINGRTLVPVRVISESYGCKVEWDEKNMMVIINGGEN